MKSLSYRYPCASLSTGSSFGNPFAFARLDARSNLLGLWSSADNQFYAGEWHIDLLVGGQTLEGTETIFRPTTQSTIFAARGCRVEKLFLLPFRPIDDPLLQSRGMRGAIFIVRAMNGPQALVLSMRHAVTFPAVPTELFTKQPNKDQLLKKVSIALSAAGCSALTRGAEHEARAFGSSITPSAAGANDQCYTAGFDVTLAPGEEAEFKFVMAFSGEGAGEAEQGLREMLAHPNIENESALALEGLLSRALLTTPDPSINRGVQWSKINTARVQHRYRIGDAFTNDPPQDIVVIRDLAWYLFGSDYLTPAFSRSLLHFGESYGYHHGGKLTEYIHADEETPEKHDYKLNINDDTPLFVIALHHYAITAGTPEDLSWIFPLMRRACEWILGQMEGGLVRCKADGTNVWGICGWRNIIDGYRLDGAVAEVNAECYRALQLTGEIAAMTGHADEARKFGGAASDLRSAINTLMVSEKTGLYLLNISGDLVRHHDVTGDLIFLPLFGVADEEMRGRILQRLTDSDMWTPFGSRTVSTAEENYDPDFGYQLVGGLWSNLTAWIAYCVRKEDPARLIEGMRNIFRICEAERPIDWGCVVPGEFPERLNGETYKSRGMTMSPWLPPTYLWLAIEGMLGFTPAFGRPSIDPALDPSWKWIAVQNLPWRGSSLTVFVFEGKVYASGDLLSPLPVEHGTLLSSRSTHPSITHIALQCGNEIVLFAASDEAAKGTVTVEHEGKMIQRQIVLTDGEAVLLRFSEGDK